MIKARSSSKKPIKKTPPKKKESSPVMKTVPKDPKYARKLDDGSIIDIRTPLGEKPKQEKLRYTVSGTPEDVVIKKEIIKSSLTPNQEMFCQYYCCNEETRFNATWSYAHAYGYDLENADTEVIRDEVTGEVLKKSERKRLENVCAASAAVLLRNAKIQARFTELFNELKKDEIVDREMMKLILQNQDNRAKQDMIKEYNALRKRIIQFQEIHHTIEDPKKMTDEELNKLIFSKTKDDQ